MPQFRGTKNLQLGSPAWAESVYDHDSRQYVITLDDDKAQDFRTVAADYGFTESDAPEAAAAPAPVEPAQEESEAEPVSEPADAETDASGDDGTAS